MKAIREKSEGTRVLLNTPCSFDGHFGHCTELHQHFCALKIVVHGFQSMKTVKVSSHENLSAYIMADCVMHLVRDMLYEALLIASWCVGLPSQSKYYRMSEP